MVMPLDGVRVIELNRVAPGSYCTMMLGDMGAEVIRIETPSQSAGAKHNEAKDDDIWVLSDYNNRNKKSLALNLKDPRAQEILQALAAESDVLVEGFRPGVTKRLGADYETLSKINPRLVYCSLSGFGQSGPYRDKAAHDMNYLAIAGVLNQIGQADAAPPIPLNIIGDYAGATMHGVIGVLLALLARDKTGQGQHVDVSYFDASFALLGAVPGIRNFFVGGPEPSRGNNVFSADYAYYTIYQTADDKWLSVGCMEPWLWENFCEAIQRPDLKVHRMQTDDFQSAANASQRAARDEVAAVMRTRTRDEWVEHFKTADVCVGEVNSLAEAVDDEHLRARNMIVPVDDPRLVGGVQPGIPIRLSETPGQIRSCPPVPGADSEAILRKLGRSESEIAELRANGVI